VLTTLVMSVDDAANLAVDFLYSGSQFDHCHFLDPSVLEGVLVLEHVG